ncbi:LOW QUALITY PROTEIN: spen family transcriptional repressor split ends [Aphomia sociella]
MVRETRHLWVGNLPDNIREDRIREHFKRYGRVQNVKLLGRTESANAVTTTNSGSSGVCATVAFMDIKSASKAHNAEHVLDERTLTTEYYEPAAIPSAAGAPSAGSSPAGSGYSGSSSSVNSAPAPASVSRYHLSGGEESTGNTCPIAATAAAPANWRGTNDSASEYCRRGNTPAAYGRYQRNNSNAPYSTPPSNVDRTTPHHRWYASGERGGGGTGGAGGATGGESTPSTPGGGTEGGRRRRHSGSGSSRSESSSPEPSDTSRASTPAAPPPLSHHPNHRTPPVHQYQWASTASGRPLAICVRNLPTRSTDSSLKDGLYHEYKKHGKVMWVKVVGQNADRYAVVRFKKPSDVEKALEVSQDKHFFGCKISVAPHQSCDEDADSAKPYETDIDEYHPKATRTLFIGNLEKDVTQQQLRDKFKHFGRIIEIDIKKGSGGGAGYAFCQYASISSVVEAIRSMDGEYVGGSRVKLGFGKPVATTCVWVDGLTEHTEKQVLGAVTRCGAATSVCVDRAAGAALVHFEQAATAGAAVRELRRVASQASVTEPDHPRLCVDYASRECQEAFYEQLEKHGGPSALTGSERLTGDLATRYVPSTRHEPLRYDNCGSRSRASSYGRGSSRTPRYSTIDHYDPTDYAADRRYRVYDELGSSPQTEETPYEDRLQSVVVSPHRARRHRRDSSPEDRKHSKERHRSVGVSGAGGVGAGIAICNARRSRSGSRGGERHAGRRRHRRRRDGSGSRAGTPLRDEPDALPCEPRRPPRERPPLPMSLPLPKFAAQLLRAAPSAPRPTPTPAPAPDSPPRPPSASSSSAGSAPHSPSLEERIRSLDEKYERWSGSRALADAPDRTRLRHRLLEVDINEVKPSEVVRSLLAKRSVFDEDSERLEGAARAPSPSGSPRHSAPCTPRALRYPFPAHPSHPLQPLTPTSTSTPTTPTLPPLSQPQQFDVDAEISDRPADPRLIRHDRSFQIDRLSKFNESDYRLDTRIRPRTPSTDRSQPDLSDRKSPRMESDLNSDSRGVINRRRRDSLFGESKTSTEISDDKEIGDSSDGIDNDYQNKQKANNMMTPRRRLSDKSREYNDDKLLASLVTSTRNELFEQNEDKITDGITLGNQCDDIIARDIADILLNEVSEEQELVKTESPIERQSKAINDYSFKSDIPTPKEIKSHLDSENKFDDPSCQIKNENENCKEGFIRNHINKELIEMETQQNHFNTANLAKVNKEVSELITQEILKGEKNGKERFSQNIIEALHNKKLEKENIEFDKCLDKDRYSSTNTLFYSEKKISDSDKEDRTRNDRDKIRHNRDRIEKEKHDYDKEKSKNNRNDKNMDKNEKDKRLKEDMTSEKNVDKSKIDRDSEKTYKDKSDREIEKTKHMEDKLRHEHHKKEKFDKDRRRDNADFELKLKREEKYKHEKSRKDNDNKRDNKKESDSIKIRKSSRDEISKDLCRKDSTDSSTSRASHDSIKLKDFEHLEIKEEPKLKVKHYNDLFCKQEEKESIIIKSVDSVKVEPIVKIKTEIKEEKEQIETYVKIKSDNNQELPSKSKGDIIEKQRHYSVDSPSLDSKRKERLNSCSSLPSNIGHKRRMSSQDSLESFNEDNKKSRHDQKCEFNRRDSKDLKNLDKHKTTKFNKGHFAKIIESKTKDDKKNQVKPPDDTFELKDNDIRDQKFCSEKIKLSKKSPKIDSEEKSSSDGISEGLHNDLDFLATLELRSSEEDEKQKALRKEMKEKKRIHQLQQIQELQLQQDALIQAELTKLKDDKKHKPDDKKKEAAREKRMSTDRKSREEKNDINKRKNRKQLQSTDSSDSDEPKKHSIFDIIDDGPTYISMYDKVKARSCKNMQKQEEEKRQEKIKAKFSQLKQSRAKREEKKRSSWDEDSDSEHDRKKTQKSSMDSSTDEENISIHGKKHEKLPGSSIDYDHSKNNDYFNMPNNEDCRNKLSRKNSRSRIMSDTSDDETSKRSLSKSPNYIVDIKKEITSDSEISQRVKEEPMLIKETDDKIKRSSLLNLFGKSDSDDSKLKSSMETDTEYKPSFIKTFSNDFSSESESIVSSRNPEGRKKHKRKQKKYKSSLSDEENKIENFEGDGDTKHKNSDKSRRHNNKKEKRKDKIRDSIENDDIREDKSKLRKEKKLINSFEYNTESISKKEGKMEDIFGPLSDESDKDARGLLSNKLDYSSHEYEPTYSGSNNQISVPNCEDIKFKERDESKRKKEKRRKEKRHFVKEDDNSLDVDAVSKAIEARLIADTIGDDDNRSNLEAITERLKKTDTSEINHKGDNVAENIKLGDKYEKLKKDCREKKKKKKRSKDERQSRKEHHNYHHHDKIDLSETICERNASLELSSKTPLLDIPLPSETLTDIMPDKPDDCKTSLSESPSLPRLTESPPVAAQKVESTETKNCESASLVPVDESVDSFIAKNTIEIDDIPMPPPIENIIKDISEVPLPNDPVPPKMDQNKRENFVSFVGDINKENDSENAVRSISNISDSELQQVDKLDMHTHKLDKKVEEKPRAIISQEETEDAVAALLGESFGGKVNTFSDYEQVENDTSHQTEIENATIENENIPEEDAEEMRQAVQNLNASEMEMKPETPVSDNDLLLIDTDTEEAEETPQDAVDRLPVNIIATTTQSLNIGPENRKAPDISNIVIAKPKTTIVQVLSSEANESNIRVSEAEIKFQLAKRDTAQQITSTSTPVITSWALTNKLLEPHVLNIQANQLSGRDKNENKPTHITANIVQIKPQNQNVQINNSLRPIITPNRVGAPYQVINQMIRPQASNVQPPTIKIPEPHVLYQKSPGFVISPRMTNDPRLQSPKSNTQGEGMTSPRLSNMTLINTSSQSLNSVGIAASPNAIQQRSPGQVTVVRMQQPPLSPIQTMHIPHSARAMVSPSRPNSVLVQTQGQQLHFNRLPVTPVLAPISKQMGVNNIVTQSKAISVSSSSLVHQQKIITTDCRKNEQTENSKIILSPTSLQQSTNPTVMAQNRLISMQNAMHANNLNSTLHLSNKVLINNMNHLNDKRDGQVQKSEQLSHIPFGSTPIIHVAGVNHSTASIIQTGAKPVVCTIQEANNINRGQNSNVIHALNPQRLLTTAPITNVIQIDANKGSPSVLSMATIRSPTVLTNLDSSNSVAVTTTTLTNVVMTPLLLKTSTSPGTIRLASKNESDQIDAHHISGSLQNHSSRDSDTKIDEKSNTNKMVSVSDPIDKQKEQLVSNVKSISPVENMAKCETDFEELLKDNTNEIKVTNDPEKKLEVNVGKTVTLFTTGSSVRDRKPSIECPKIESPNSKSRSEEIQEKLVIDNNQELVSKASTKLEKENSATSSETVIESDLEVSSNSSQINIMLSNTSNEDKTFSDLENKVKSEENEISNILSNQSENIDNQIKNLDESDSWSAKDVNIDSVIKKVDSLCNDNIDTSNKELDFVVNEVSKPECNIDSNTFNKSLASEEDNNKSLETLIENRNDNMSDELNVGKAATSCKRGGRSMRGKKSEKNQDRIQTRQISKPARGTSTKRGRGRAKVDKKIKNLVNNSSNNIPGDVYDFHEDSGDETTSSPSKSEARPRLILTIKSPQSGHSNAIATSSLSIQKDHNKSNEKLNKDDKTDDFISPSPNTRKSRRLQEKDVQRSTVDDIIDDVVKGSTPTKNSNKKRPGRQTALKVNHEKITLDTRKSPRGVKRTRDRSLSDASVDSGDEKIVKKEDLPKEGKIPRLVEQIVTPKVEPEPPAVKTPAPAVVVQSSTTSTPIMKPPKKMISEISAKLASAFEAAAAAGPPRAPTTVPNLIDRVPQEADKQAPIIRDPRILEPATAAPATSDIVSTASGINTVRVEPQVTDVRFARRLVDGVPGSMMPVGTEATDARVQSPALPHRPPSTHRPADRATPVLIRRGGAGADLGMGVNVGMGVGGMGAAGPGGSRGFRAAYADAASLPRGAHHPTHPPHPPHPSLPPHPHHHIKQVAVVGPHHHPGSASRVTLTSVPTISPQGQMALGEGMYPHFSHQHYQMYQQHFRATQHDNRTTPSPYTRSLEAEGSEAPTPPLELRRPTSARVPRPAHSPSPADRLIMYAVGCGRSPPPAHGTSRLAAALPPPAAPGPPHASQVPREADSLQMLLRRYPVMWQGLLALKNDSAAVQMHFVGGNPGVAADTLPRLADGSTPLLRIAQRMRLEPTQLDQVHRKMQMESEHCMLLALPCGRDHMDVLQQSTNLTAGFITYLQRKQAAGIVNVAPPGHQQAMFTVHIFPSCDFANENLNRIAPDLMHRVADIAHLLIVIATV